MRVSVFKPQRALEVRRSILWSRCLSELLEPAQPSQLSCQKGESCETVGASWICMGQSDCKNWGSCAGFGVTVSIQTQGAQKVCKRQELKRVEQDSFGSYLSWRGPVGSSLFQSQLSRVCMCACQCGCMCVEQSNPPNQILWCFVAFDLSQWDLMCIPTMLSKKCPGL